jgi:hypothetical protein
MTKWKWMIAHKTPAKLFLINENGIISGLIGQIWQSSGICTFCMGLTGAGAIGTIGRLLFSPSALVYLLLFALLAIPAGPSFEIPDKTPMKLIQVLQHGGPEQLQYVDVEISEAGSRGRR